MLVRDIMNKDVVTTKPDITVKEAAAIMSRYHIGSIVMISDGKIVGIITERNILVSIADGRDPELTTIEEIMAKKVITIEPGKTIDDAVGLMAEKKIKKLPVVDGDKLVGIITASDIIVVEPKLIESVANLLSIKMPGYRGG